MLRAIKIVSNIFTFIFIVLILLTFIFIIQAKVNPNNIPSLLGFKPLTVLSGSMQPALDPGDMIVVRETRVEDVRAGDIITFRENNTHLVTHRVVDVIRENSIVKFQTQGDANNSTDQNLVTGEQLIGKLVISVPYGGYIGEFARTKLGFLLLIILPTALLIAGEVRSIYKQINRKSEGKAKEMRT